MSHTRARRRAPIITLLTSAALVGSSIAPATAADTAPARTAGGWLAGQVSDGIVLSFGGWRDHGLTLDTLAAMRATSTDAATRSEIVDVLRRPEEVEAYTTYTPEGGTTQYFPGQAGKLLTAMALAKRPVPSVGDGTVLSDLEAAVTSSGRAGGAGVEDYANTLNQAWIVRALALTGSPKLGAATRFLLRQQCSGGGFRPAFDDGVGCASGAPGTRSAGAEATALAVWALLDARAAGVPNLGDDLADARTWLVKAQSSGGAFVGDGVPNANATGLAGDALRRLGAAGAAGNAAGWLLARQVTSSVIAQSPALRGERGAVAYDGTALAKARRDGITGDSVVYEWRKSTADSVLGLLGLLPSKQLNVVAPDRAYRGTKVTVRVKGLRAGERFVLRRNGGVVASGLVPASGVAKRQVALPRKGRTTLRATGSRPGRVGSTAVQVRVR